MISKYRNRSILYAILAITLSILLVITFRKAIAFHASDDWMPLSIILYFAAWAMWILTSLSLARAKGYSRDLAGTLVLISLIIGFCLLPIVAVLMPFYIIFGLKDKTRSRH